MKETAIYIHIPFCDHKCIYCDFYSIIRYGDADTYLSALLTEIEYFAKVYSEERRVISIFFGGGTPSFMEPDYIGRILNALKDRFYFDAGVEITLETNPGTVSREKLIDFRERGINRLSIGVQSFNEDELKFMTRIHDSQTAINTVNDAFDAGFENISIDLIFNLPNQTKEKWQKNLDFAMRLPLKHISAYSLILEPGTILNKMVVDGKIKIEGDDYDAELYEQTIQFLTSAGFRQYEVSNFALPGYECKHNNAYWHHKDYLGFGTSAHSFVNGRRWWNYSSVKFYNASIEKNGNAVAGSEVLTRQQLLDEYVMLALRSDGLDLKELSQKFGIDWISRNSKTIDKFAEEGYLQKNDKYIKLTPKGYTLCDEILQKLV